MVKALDFFSALGDIRATHLQKPEEEKHKGYKEQIMEWQKHFGKLRESDWTESVYSLWIYLTLLLNPLPEGYPSFMRTTAWNDKSLMTAHGTWTELRYDSILYAKQAYALTMGMPPPPPPPAERLCRTESRIL